MKVNGDVTDAMSALPPKADIRDIWEPPVTIRIFFSCGIGEIA